MVLVNWEGHAARGKPCLHVREIVLLANNERKWNKRNG